MDGKILCIDLDADLVFESGEYQIYYNKDCLKSKMLFDKYIKDLNDEKGYKELSFVARDHKYYIIHLIYGETEKETVYVLKEKIHKLYNIFKNINEFESYLYFSTCELNDVKKKYGFGPQKGTYQFYKLTYYNALRYWIGSNNITEVPDYIAMPKKDLIETEKVYKEWNEKLEDAIFKDIVKI